MDINKIFKSLDKVYDFNSQAVWDTSCLHDHKKEISNVLVTLDINDNTIEFCKSNNIDLIISHHPLFISQETTDTKLAIKHYQWLKNNNISLIYLHTPFDSSIHGMNHEFLKRINCKNVKYGTNTKNYVVGEFDDLITVDHLAYLMKDKYQLDFVRYNQKYENNLIKKVAFCSGSGSSFIYELNDEIDVFITGDTKYHTWIDADDLKIIIIDINHNIENMFVDIIKKHMEALDIKLNIFTIKSDLTFKFI